MVRATEPVKPVARRSAKAAAAAMKDCLLRLRERAAAGRRADEVAMIDATLAGDIRASVLARTGPVDLTERQWQVVELIERHRQELGYAPTLDEMAAELGKSRVTVHCHVEALKAKGVLARDTYANRGVHVVSRN